MCAAVLLWMGMRGQTQPARYQITALPLPNGFRAGAAVTMNAGGDVAGWISNGTVRRPALWKAAGGVQELPLPTDSRLGFANSINASGDVVGVAGGSLTQRAVLWKAGGAVIEIGKNLPGSSSANSINRAGQVVGAYVTSSGMRAFLWSPTGGGAQGKDPLFEDLGRVTGAYGVIATSINDSGMIAGYLQTFTGDRPFLWTRARGIRPIEILPGDNNGQAFALNQEGQLIGSSWNRYRARPFLWAAGIEMIALAGSQNAMVGAAWGISPDGFIAGHLNNRPTLWNSAGFPHDIIARLADTTGWQVNSLQTLTLNGANRVAGSCARDGQIRPVLLTPTPNVTAQLSTFQLNLTSITGGSEIELPNGQGIQHPVQGTVTLTERAPSGGLRVEMSSSNTALVPLPARVTVPAGQTTLTFPVPTNPVTQRTAVVLTARQNGVVRQVTLTLYPPQLASFRLTSPRTRSGQTVTGILSLDGRAPTGGVAVSLSASDPETVTLPATLTIPANQRSVSFAIRARTVRVSTRIILTAVSNGRSYSNVLFIQP
jgi:uncharacterized membrane protein